MVAKSPLVAYDGTMTANPQQLLIEALAQSAAARDAMESYTLAFLTDPEFSTEYALEAANAGGMLQTKGYYQLQDLTDEHDRLLQFLSAFMGDFSQELGALLKESDLLGVAYNRALDKLKAMDPNSFDEN